MTRRRPLPVSLRGTAFTSDDRALHGVSRNRLKAGDITTLSRGVYRSTSAGQLAADLEDQDTAVLLRKIGAVLSHRSAAQWHGIPLPGWMDGLDDLEVTVPHRQHTSIRSGVLVHRRPLPQAHAVIDRGVWVTTPERTWCDLASLFRPGQEGHVVAAGDHLVTPPWTPKGRGKATSTLGSIRRTLIESGRFKGGAAGPGGSAAHPSGS